MSRNNQMIQATPQDAQMRIGVSSGMSGFYAVLYDSETGEPWNTGCGRYARELDAIMEAVGWAESDEIRLDQKTADLARSLGLIK